MEEVENIEFNETNSKKLYLWNFLLHLRDKKLINDFDFEFEKECSFYVNEKIVSDHLDVISGDLLEFLDNDNEKLCALMNIINGRI